MLYVWVHTAQFNLGMFEFSHNKIFENYMGYMAGAKFLLKSKSVTPLPKQSNFHVQ